MASWTVPHVAILIAALACTSCILVSHGRRVEGAQAAIINGLPVQRKDYPFYCDVITTKGRGGGVLTSPSFVLTAAHVVLSRSPDMVVVYVGSEMELRQVAAIAIHPLYKKNDGSKPEHSAYDIAVLKLKRPVQKVGIGLVQALPSRGANVLTVGRGLTSPPDQPSAQIPLDKLNSLWMKCNCAASTPYLAFAHAPRKGPCNGDSGSPVLLPTRNGYRLLSVLAVAFGVCDTTVRSDTAYGPSIPFHSLWIRQTMLRLGI